LSYFKLACYALIRVVFNTAYRMVYPFLVVFARGLGVDIQVISNLIGNRAILGVVNPFLFPFIETRGRKFGMLLGVGLFILGMGLVALYPSLLTLGISLVLVMLSKSIFDPSLASYIADHVVYEKRGAVLGFMEVAWSLAFIIGVPAAGWMIAHGTWSSPFWVMGMLGIAALLFVAWSLQDSAKPARHVAGIFGGLKDIFTSRAVLVAFFIGLAVSGANEMVNLMFGVWLEDSFKLQIAALAGASAVIGLSELGGEGLVGLFVDRLGKVRAAGLGIMTNCLAALLLPLIGRSTSGALVGLFLFYITFEFTIVSIIPLMTEMMPSARATTMSFGSAGNYIGRAIGAFVAPSLYSIGFIYLIVAAIVFNVLGLTAVWYVSKHHE
jgi:predicted MFS family arabinose efflux permease